MKKRIIYYCILVVIVVAFLVFNYSSVQKCGDITVTSIISGENIIVEGELNGNYRSVRSVSYEKEGNSVFIKIEAVNDFFGASKNFDIMIPNKNNSVEKIYLRDKKDSVVVFINSEYGKKTTSTFGIENIKIEETGN